MVIILSGEKIQTRLPTSFIGDTQLANAFVGCFYSKIMLIRGDIDISTLRFSLPNFTGPCLESYKVLSEEEFTTVFGAMKMKRCSFDPIPSDILSKCFHSMKPFILQIINKSLASGIFPTELKHSVIHPIIKNVDGDVNDLKILRLVSNICFF